MPLNFLLNILLLKPNHIIIEQDILSLNVLISWFLSLLTRTNIILQTYENISPLSKNKNTKSIFKKILYLVQYLLIRSLFFIPKILLTVSYDSFCLFKKYKYNTRLISLGVNNNHFHKLKLSREKVIKKFAKDFNKEIQTKINKKETIIYSYVGRLVQEKGIIFCWNLSHQIKI